MKARIRKTGEIVDVISYNIYSTIRSHQDYVSYIDSKGEEHDRESLNYYWDFEPIDTMAEVRDDKHWQDVRERAAIAALGGLSSNSKLVYDNGEEKINPVARAIKYADELVERLKKKVQ